MVELSPMVEGKLPNERNPNTCVLHHAFSVGLLFFLYISIDLLLFIRLLSDKEPSCQTGDVGLFPGSERSPAKEMASHSSILA